VEQYNIALILKHIKGKASTRYRHWILTHANEQFEKFCVTVKGKSIFRIWQVGGGYDRNLCDDEAIHNVTNYIEWNPVRAGLVEKPEDWPWSSAKARLTGQGVVPDEEVIPWLER
jgi:REP element-mobilizing transposase RayT